MNETLLIKIAEASRSYFELYNTVLNSVDKIDFNRSMAFARNYFLDRNNR